MQLSKSRRFQEDINSFKNKLASVDNEKIKKEIEALISKLIGAVNDIDYNHQQLIIQNRLPLDNNDSKTRIAEIRNEIIKKLAVAEKSQA